MPAKNKHTYYAVRRGHTTGLFEDWSLVQRSVHRFSGAEYKGFVTRAQAEQWLNNDVTPAPAMSTSIAKSFAHTVEAMSAGSPVLQAELLRVATAQNHGRNTLVINVDGGCSSNGSPDARAGFGVWFAHDSFLNTGKRLNPKAARPSNQTAELYAAIWALTLCSAYPHPIVLRTDSTYVKKSLTEWIHAWKKNGWLTASKTPVVNRQHIEMLDALIQTRPATGRVTFEWIKGHSGDDGNTRADELASEGIMMDISE